MMALRKKIILTLIFLLIIICSSMNAQVGINTSVVDSFSALQIESLGSQGLRLPQVDSLAAVDSLIVGNESEARGLVVYSPTDNLGAPLPGVFFWDGTKWQFLNTVKGTGLLSVNPSSSKILSINNAISQEDVLLDDVSIDLNGIRITPSKLNGRSNSLFAYDDNGVPINKMASDYSISTYNGITTKGVDTFGLGGTLAADLPIEATVSNYNIIGKGQVQFGDILTVDANVSKVGINTPNPRTALDVNGSQAQSVEELNVGSSLILSPGNGKITLIGNPGGAFILDDSQLTRVDGVQISIYNTTDYTGNLGNNEVHPTRTQKFIYSSLSGGWIPTVASSPAVNQQAFSVPLPIYGNDWNFDSEGPSPANFTTIAGVSDDRKWMVYKKISRTFRNVAQEYILYQFCGSTPLDLTNQFIQLSVNTPSTVNDNTTSLMAQLVSVDETVPSYTLDASGNVISNSLGATCTQIAVIITRVDVFPAAWTSQLNLNILYFNSSYPWDL